MNQCDKSVTCNVLKTCQSHRVLTLFEYITEEREMVGCDKIWTLCGSIPPKLPLKEIFPHNHCHRSQSHYSILPKECCELAGTLLLCCVQNSLSSLTHYWKNVSQALNGSNTKTKPKFKYLRWHFQLFVYAYFLYHCPPCPFDLLNADWIEFQLSDLCQRTIIF